MSKLLKRRAVVKQLLAERGEMLVVGGLGASAWDIRLSATIRTIFRCGARWAGPS